MEVLSTSLANNTRVALVVIQVRSDILPKLLEDESASGEVKGSEFGVSDHLGNNFSGRTRDELKDTSRETSFLEDLVDEVVGVGSGR